MHLKSGKKKASCSVSDGMAIVLGLTSFCASKESSASLILWQLGWVYLISVQSLITTKVSELVGLPPVVGYT